jgi:hypothetical protein
MTSQTPKCLRPVQLACLALAGLLMGSAGCSGEFQARTKEGDLARAEERKSKGSSAAKNQNQSQGNGSAQSASDGSKASEPVNVAGAFLVKPRPRKCLADLDNGSAEASGAVATAPKRSLMALCGISFEATKDDRPAKEGLRLADDIEAQVSAVVDENTKNLSGLRVRANTEADAIALAMQNLITERVFSTDPRAQTQSVTHWPYKLSDTRWIVLASPPSDSRLPSRVEDVARWAMTFSTAVVTFQKNLPNLILAGVAIAADRLLPPEERSVMDAFLSPLFNALSDRGMTRIERTNQPSPMGSLESSPQPVESVVTGNIFEFLLGPDGLLEDLFL